MAKTIVVDVGRCLGCKSCEIECALAHSEAGTMVEALQAETLPQARIHVEVVGESNVPMQCQHCDDAPCIVVCPSGALHRSEDALVLLDSGECIGCGQCLLVCPFGVIDMARDGKVVVKCDLCPQRVAAGQEPACAAGCPTGALQYRDVTETVPERRHEAAARMASATADLDGELT